ncbi:Sjogren's syndrome/scleroderma autoantigen 1 family protein [Halococcus sp. AFM35]|uniref:Sjogren's syndrome/scleroderma autoantigen 1 family protein n=1 Tax=Halococcus sp. AFM35 TaxID=3421653 RepID=UPI003EB8F2DE
MSDFDKEAEREKLRERFAEEDEKRKTTEQMSELLLQGATMTDTHCDTCGSPLFRYDGQTFCPTCQQATTEGGADGRAATTDAAADEPASTTANGGQAASERPQTRPNRTDRTPQSTTQQPRSSGSAPTRNRRAATSPTDGDTQGRDGPQPETTTRPAGGANDLDAAEASLSRTLAELTATAEETEDLGRKREHLAAAREAAEALDAVRTARK